MRYTFLTDADITVQLKDELRAQLTQNNTALIGASEQRAVEWAKGFLNNRYDVAAIFNSVTDHIPATDYLKDAQVFYQDEFWLCLQPTNTAPTEGANWTQADRRSQLLVDFIADITIHILLKRIAGNKISQVRTDAYANAKEWLEAVRDGKMTPELPRLVVVDDTDPESVDTVKWGSNPKQDHLF
jgi:hypothetical protein